MSSNRMDQAEAPKLDAATTGATFNISNLFDKDNQRSFLDMAKSALPPVFDNGFSIAGLEDACKKGLSSLKFDSNMPVLQYDSSTGPGDGMPVLKFDSTTGPQDNMPVITPEDLYMGGGALGGCGPSDAGVSSGMSSGPEYSIGNATPGHALGGHGGTETGSDSGASSGSASGGTDTYTFTDRGDSANTTPGNGDAPRVKDEDVEPKLTPKDTLTLPNEGRSITDLDPKINPRLGCALAVSSALHELDKDFPVTTNNRELARLLIQHGYDMSKQEGGVDAGKMQPGDVVIGRRQGDMPGHAAIYKGDGKTYENNSDTGRITGDGDLNYFNQKMHDSKGNWNKNGFDSVYVFRKLSPADLAKRDAEIASHY